MQQFEYSNELSTQVWSDKVDVLLCPRCGAETLHHEGVIVYDRREDADTVVRTDVAAGKIAIDAKASNANNPSNRRDGIVVRFSCEQCGDDPIELTIAQHKGSTEIGWRFVRSKAAD